LEALRIIAGLLKPYLVETPCLIGQQIGIEEMIKNTKWEDLKQWGLLPAGIKVNEAEPIFPRIDLEEYFAEKEIDSAEKEEEANLISFDDFSKTDLRVAEILTAEKIEGSNKLLKLEVDLGEEKRQLVAGIAKHYQPDELPGKKILMVANLEPATIYGVESNGMILAASNDKGELTLTTVENDIANGSRVK